MTRESRLWLVAAGVVAIVVLAAVLIFGIHVPPRYPSLYDGGPTVVGSVAYVEPGQQDCVRVLDVATGDSREVYCSEWVWLQGWDADGNLRVEDGSVDRVAVVDPDSGALVARVDFAGESYREVAGLQARSEGGHATLTYSVAGAKVTLIEVDGPRNYGFRDYGLTRDERYVWVCDSEEQLIVVAVDGSGGPWLVAGDISDPAWR